MIIRLIMVILLFFMSTVHAREFSTVGVCTSPSTDFDGQRYNKYCNLCYRLNNSSESIDKNSLQIISHYYRGSGPRDPDPPNFTIDNGRVIEVCYSYRARGDKSWRSIGKVKLELRGTVTKVGGDKQYVGGVDYHAWQNHPLVTTIDGDKQNVGGGCYEELIKKYFWIEELRVENKGRGIHIDPTYYSDVRSCRYGMPIKFTVCPDYKESLDSCINEATAQTKDDLSRASREVGSSLSSCFSDISAKLGKTIVPNIGSPQKEEDGCTGWVNIHRGK